MLWIKRPLHLLSDSRQITMPASAIIHEACLRPAFAAYEAQFSIFIPNPNKARTCQAWMHLNIEQPSIISSPGPALEMKGKRAERPGLVKRFKSADICISLKIKCIGFFHRGGGLRVSSTISLVLSTRRSAFRRVTGKTNPLLMATNCILISA